MGVLTFFDPSVRQILGSISCNLFSYLPASFINVREPTQFTEVKKYLRLLFFYRQEKKLNLWTYEMHSQENIN